MGRRRFEPLAGNLKQSFRTPANLGTHKGFLGAVTATRLPAGAWSYQAPVKAFRRQGVQPSPTAALVGNRVAHADPRPSDGPPLASTPRR